MGYFGHDGYELRDIHDWNNPFRLLIDLIEVPVAILLSLFGLTRALIPGIPIWACFTHWHDFWMLVSGVILLLAGLLLLRDWGYGLFERREEQMCRKLFEEERARIVRDRVEHELPGGVEGE